MNTLRARMFGVFGLLAAASLLGREARAQTGSPTGVQPEAPQPAPRPGAVSATAVPVPEELLHLSPGGLTSDQVGRRAAATSFTVKQNEESLLAAAARVDESWQAFLPKLRTSGALYWVDITNPPSLGTVVVDTAGAGPVTTLAGGKLKAVPLNLPSTLGSYLLQATISVPISDYFLKLGQTHAAANDSRDAARYDLEESRATSSANGRVAYYTWLRARGAVIVAILAMNDQKTHLALAANQYTVGRASRADVLRAETDVASAELTYEQAKNLAALSEKQVRVAMHAKDNESLLPGESLETVPPAVPGTLRSLEDEGVGRRAEIKSLAANAASLREQAKATRNAGYPSLSASGNAIAANTNTANLGPSSQWIGVWYLGAQVSWSPNETGLQASAGADASHRAAALDAEAQQTKDNIEVEVTRDYQNVHQADVSVDAAQRELASAEEAHRVAKELFDNGRATSSELTDAETELTRARLDVLNARVNARVSRVQLEHALGRDLGGA
jgi:outer membrane protein